MPTLYKFGSKAEVEASAGDFAGAKYGGRSDGWHLAKDVVRVVLSSGRTSLVLHIHRERAEQLKNKLKAALQQEAAA